MSERYDPRSGFRVEKKGDCAPPDFATPNNAPRSPVFQSLENLRLSIKASEEQQERLTHKLSGVLTPETPDNAIQGNPCCDTQRAESDVVVELRSATGRLDQLVRRYNAMMERLEV